MEVLGYVHRGGLDKPKSEIVEGLNEEFQALSVQDQADETPSLFAQGGPRSEQFIEYSINVSLPFFLCSQKCRRLFALWISTRSGVEANLIIVHVFLQILSEFDCFIDALYCQIICSIPKLSPSGAATCDH